MKLRIAIGAGVLILLGTYIIGMKGSPYLFIVYVPFASFLLLLISIFLAVEFFWWVLPPRIKGKYEGRTSRFRIIAAGCFFGLLVCFWLVNRFLLPGSSTAIRLIGNAAVLFFVLFFGWSLITQKNKRITMTGILLFIGVISLAALWNSVQTDRSQPLSARNLKTLPYVKWVPAADTKGKSGVTLHDDQRAFQGVNLYCLRNFSEAYLADMDGNVRHTWQDKGNRKADWHHIELCENGDLLAVVYMGLLTKLDWNSEVKWTKKMHFHHDIAVAENNDIYALASKPNVVFLFGLPLPILDDSIVILSPEGEVKGEISLFKMLKKKVPVRRVFRVYRELLNPRNLWKAIQPRKKNDLDFSLASHVDIFFTHSYFDVLHNNTILIIDRNIDGLCQKGDILISARELDLIGIVDMNLEKLLWSWGAGQLSRQHHPTLLANGNILVFDNGCRNGYSRIIELNPLTEEIVWEYKATPPEQFYSEIGGSCQRLPNGNTLITEEYKGRVFEITKAGKIVWEFYTPLNPEKEKDGLTRAAIYRMKRLSFSDIPSEFRMLE